MAHRYHCTTSSRCFFGGSSSYNTPICNGPESTSSLVCSEEISEDCVGTVDRVRYGAWSDIVFNIFERVKRSCELSYIWHTDIIADGGFDEVERLIAQATKYPKKNGIIGIIYHPEGKEEEDKGHIHVYHNCNYSCSTCRCSFLRGFRVKRRRHRHNVCLRFANTKEYWYKWVKYFITPPRRLLHLEIAGMDFCGQVLRNQDIRQSQQTKISKTNGNVETSCLLCEDVITKQREERINLSQNQQEVGSNNENEPSTSTAISISRFKPGGSLRQKGLTVRQLVDILLDFVTVPIESTCHLPKWVNNEHLCLYDSRDRIYQIAVTTLQRRLQFYDFNQFVNVHAYASCPTYYSNGNPSHYLSVAESMDAIEKLLLFQYGDFNGVKDFIITLFNICERKYPKLNSIYVEGPANSGKSWFFYMVAAFYINVGHVKNFVRGQNFPLNDCGNRRILIWNEPSIMPSAYDTVKMLTGGDPCPAAVKYQNDATISKTPVIFTANNKVFNFSDSIWSSRIKYYHWNACDLLRDIDRYPHPLCYEKLVNKYVNQ
ncbi:putative NS1 protein [Tetranychus urticae-associated ambidensovirus]|uniref:Putative NS1 protein n=1 Tax=Tetranychus urticae-associated ambidensovirus TaxID=2555904 RepID=A0A482G2U9_9VIRU|nr:putative NS1 protein [Tetranychus urticae-associated ambidensovirus]QBO56618.1 putative NS1 protein [Tetranychus urticae-associated ambidensovirus]